MGLSHTGSNLCKSSNFLCRRRRPRCSPGYVNVLYNADIAMVHVNLIPPRDDPGATLA